MGGQPKPKPGSKSYRDGTKKGAAHNAAKHKTASTLGKMAKGATGTKKSILAGMKSRVQGKRSY